MHLHLPLTLHYSARNAEALYSFTNLLTLSIRSFPIRTW